MYPITLPVSYMISIVSVVSRIIPALLGTSVKMKFFYIAYIYLHKKACLCINLEYFDVIHVLVVIYPSMQNIKISTGPHL